MRTKDLTTATSTNPPTGPYQGGQFARRDRAAAAFGDAIRVLGNGRRVVATAGLHGAEGFQVLSVSPEAAAPQKYPSLLTVRYVARRRFRLTPGHFLYLSALVNNSGQTQKPQGAGFQRAGAAGAIQVYARFDNGTDVDDAFFMKYLPVSDLEYAAENTENGAGWTELHRVEIGLIYPEHVAQGDVDDLRKWSEGVTVTLDVAYVAGVRCVDLCVQEVPIAYARDAAADDPAWMIPMLGAAAKVTDPDVAAVYPVDELAADDPAAGTTLLAAAARRQQAELGPVLAEWSGWDESTQSVLATDAAGAATSSTSDFEELLSGVIGWSDAAPGWSIASGGNARDFSTSSHLLELRDKDACAAVRISVYAARTASGTARLQFRSALFDLAELEISSATFAWYEITAHLRCGLGPEDASVLQVLGKVAAGSSSLIVRHLGVEFLAP